jgi:hypothetical protein
MSTYQIVAEAVYRGLDLAGLKARFWQWWIGLYAAPPRRLPPML